MRQATLILFGAIILGIGTAGQVPAQSSTAGLYQQMSPTEQANFVEEQAKGIARQISGSEYQFTPAFEMEIQRSIDDYVKRIGNNAGDRPGRGEMRYVFERGRTVAPTLIAIFKGRSVSPLVGLYLPLIESEYLSAPGVSSMGAVGMFQFMPATGKRYGLTRQELSNVEKSADAAARYISDNVSKFADDPMKEALALLAYNRGAGNVSRDLELVLNDQNRQCSICALTAARARLDQTFQDENVHYLPRFFAAAIVGENPQGFGLQIQPLSSYERKQ